MAKSKDLEEALTNIETKLGGDKLKLKNLGEHLEYIESLIGSGGGDSRSTLHTDYIISLNWDPETVTGVPLFKFLDADGQILDTPPEEFRQEEGFGVCLAAGPYSNYGTPEITNYYYYYEDGTTIHIDLLSNSFDYGITQNIATGEIISEDNWFIINTANIDNLSIHLIYDVADEINVNTNAYLDTLQDWNFFAWSIEDEQIPVIVIYNDNPILDWALATNVLSNEDTISFVLVTSHGLINVEVADGESGIEYNINWDNYIAPAGGGQSSDESIPIIDDKWFEYDSDTHSFILTDESGEKYAPIDIDSIAYIGVQDPTNNNTMELMLATFKRDEDFGHFVLTSLDGQKIITLVTYTEAPEDGPTSYFYTGYYCTEEDVFNQSNDYIVLYFTTPAGLPYTTYYIPRIYNKILVLKKFKWDTIDTISAPFADDEADVNELLHISGNGQYCILQEGSYHNASIKFITLVFAERE